MLKEIKRLLKEADEHHEKTSVFKREGFLRGDEFIFTTVEKDDEYKAFRTCVIEASDKIQEFTEGKIDFLRAVEMILVQRRKLMSILKEYERKEVLANE